MNQISQIIKCNALKKHKKFPYLYIYRQKYKKFNHEEEKEKSRV